MVAKTEILALIVLGGATVRFDKRRNFKVLLVRNSLAIQVFRRCNYPLILFVFGHFPIRSFRHSPGSRNKQVGRHWWDEPLVPGDQFHDALKVWGVWPLTM